MDFSFLSHTPKSLPPPPSRNNDASPLGSIEKRALHPPPHCVTYLYHRPQIWQKLLKLTSDLLIDRPQGTQPCYRKIESMSEDSLLHAPIQFSHKVITNYQFASLKISDIIKKQLAYSMFSPMCKAIPGTQHDRDIQYAVLFSWKLVHFTDGQLNVVVVAN